MPVPTTGGGAIGGNPSNPLAASTLFEYPFTDGSGSTASDVSGSGNNATLGLSGSFVPTWISGGGLNFSDALLQFPASVWPNLQALYILQDFEPYSTNKESALPCIFSTSGSSWFNLPAGQVYTGDQTAGAGFGTSQSIAGQNGLLWVLDYANNMQHVYWNGIESLGYINPTPAPPSAGTPASFWLNFLVGVGLPNTTKTYYVMGFSAVPTSTQAQAIHQYAAYRVRGRAGLSIGNTQSTNTAYVVFDGDSLTAGAETSYGHDRPTGAMNSLSNVYPYAIPALGGQTTAQILAAYPTRVSPLWAQYSGKKIYILEAGINDCIYTSDSAATIFSRIQSIVALAVADGATVAVHTNTPATDTSSVETTRQALLTLILANASNYTVPGISGKSLGEDPIIGAAGSQDNTTYYATDKTHLNNAGTAIAQMYDVAFLVGLGLS